MTTVPATDVEGAVLDHLQQLLAAPELVARTCAAAKREAEDEITEREVTVLLADFATVWGELFPTEQARIVQLLVEQVVVRRHGLEIRLRIEGLASVPGSPAENGVAAKTAATSHRAAAGPGAGTSARLARPVVVPGGWTASIVECGWRPGVAASSPGIVVVAGGDHPASYGWKRTTTADVSP